MITVRVRRGQVGGLIVNRPGSYYKMLDNARNVVATATCQTSTVSGRCNVFVNGALERKRAGR